MLHVSELGCVQCNVILGQDLHYGSDLQPPLCFWDAVPIGGSFHTFSIRHNLKNKFTVTVSDIEIMHLTQNQCLPSTQREAGG